MFLNKLLISKAGLVILSFILSLLVLFGAAFQYINSNGPGTEENSKAPNEGSNYCRAPFINDVYEYKNSIYNTYVVLCGADVIESGIQIRSTEDNSIISEEDLLSGWANGIYVEEEYAYIANGPNGLSIINIEDPKNPFLKSNIDTDGYANSVFIKGNRAFLADGTGGLKIIDISDKKKPSLLETIDTSGYVFDVYIVDNYAYVADGSSGLKIMDISE